MTSTRLAWLLGALFATATGCSLINSYDDVKEHPDNTGAGSGGSAGGDSGGSAGTGGEAGTSGAGGTAGSADDAGDAPDDTVLADTTIVDAPKADADGGVVDAPIADAADAGPAITGAIVVGGTLVSVDGGSPYVLAVVDPATGKEITRESMHVGGIAYDGLATGDLWYIFEYTTSNLPGTLHIRKMDAHGKWLPEVGTLKNIPFTTSPHSMAVLNGRLVYIASFAFDGGTSQQGYVVIDTSNPAAPKVLSSGANPLTSVSGTGPLLGIVGIPNLHAVGGVVQLAQGSDTCPPNDAGGYATCDLLVRRMTVTPTQAVLGNADRVGSYPSTGGLVASAYDFGGSNNLPSTLFAFPGAGPFPDDEAGYYDPVAHIQRFDDTNHQPVGPSYKVTINGGRILAMAYAECLDVAVIIDQLNDKGLFAVPLAGDGGAGAVKATLATAVPEVVYEPYTSTLLRPFGSASLFDLTAYKLTLNGAVPVLKARTADWSPSTLYKPDTVAVKHPVPPVCQ